jgi:hypothetical protein
MREDKPKKAKKEMKQIHFDMDIETYLKVEKAIYDKGYSLSEYFRKKALEALE